MSQISPDVLRLHIRSTLQMIPPLWSPDAEELLLGTAAQESRLGYYRRQLHGPARGIYQMEPATERSMWLDSLKHRPSLSVAIRMVTGVMSPSSDQLEHNIAYQTVMARLRYFLWVKPPVPTTLKGQAEYWDKHYNCNPEKGTPGEYIENYQKLISNRVF